MFKYRKLTFRAIALIAVMVVLAACSAEESAPEAADEAVDSQAAVDAVKAAEEDTAEEPGDGDSESSADFQVPTNSSQVPRMSVEELKERLDKGEEIIIIDTRAETSYDTRHIAGAISVPSVFEESPLDDLELEQDIVLYCT